MSANSTTQQQEIGTVLVAGAGVAGMRAALDLAALGYRVVLTDSSPAIVGILAQLDHQFPNNHCGICQMLPAVDRDSASQYCMRKGLFHENIQLLPSTSITSVQGEAGAFAVELRRQPRFVDPDRCGCEGRCVDVCPIEVADEFNQGLTRRKAIFRPVPQQLPNSYYIDPQTCTRCGECVKVCPVNAINLEAQAECRTVRADAVILAAGIGLDDPSTTGPLKASSPNVLTSLAFERLLSLSPARAGNLRRPSDGKPLKRIAWLQCAGSRDRKQERDYCSSICCMFALKEAVLAHEKGGPDLETAIFYMDLRAFGKGHHRYREAAEKEHGVRLVRCRVHEIVPLANGDLRIRYIDPMSGNTRNEIVEMAVLATGQAPERGHQELARLFDLTPDAAGFLPSLGFDKVKTPRTGVFLCGSLTGLSDISEAVVGGSAAASEAARLMIALGREAAAPPPRVSTSRDCETALPRIDVILCRCFDPEMQLAMDWGDIKTKIGRRSGIGEIHIVDGLCGDEGVNQVSALLRKSDANRVLFGVCRPHVYQPTFQNLARRAGFNPGLINVVDLYGPLGKYGTEKNSAVRVRTAINALNAALDDLKTAEPVSEIRIPITQSALVIGGGVAGMQAAVSLAERGVPVQLVERSETLGGRVAKELHYTLDGSNPQRLVSELQKRVAENSIISVNLQSEIVESSGSLGCFQSVVRKASGEESLVSHGATIIATGGGEVKPHDYGYGTSERILTQAELESRLATGTLNSQQLQTVVMIQCVESRLEGFHEYCSRVCCASALKNSFKILESNPTAQIMILNRDMMTYGRSEAYYTEARSKGILFSKYDAQDPPKVMVAEGSLSVRFIDPIIHRPIELATDLLVLSTGMEPDRGNVALARIFGVESDSDGFFLEADAKWRPVDFLKDGIFMAGVAHSPQPVREVIAQAEACAQRAFAYLSRKEINAGRFVSTVRHAICARCLACIQSCPYGARTLDVLDHRIEVNPASCKACGSCATVCPSGAAEVMGFGNRQVMSTLDALLEEV